jgi:hypothetical protein
MTCQGKYIAAMRSTVYRKQAKLNYSDPAVQLRINEACEAVRTGEIGNISLTAYKFKIPYTTLRNRYHGFTQPTREAHEHNVSSTLVAYST